MPSARVPVARCQGCQLFPEALPAWPACPPTALLLQSCHLLPREAREKEGPGQEASYSSEGAPSHLAFLPESQSCSQPRTLEKKRSPKEGRLAA